MIRRCVAFAALAAAALAPAGAAAAMPVRMAGGSLARYAPTVVLTLEANRRVAAPGSILELTASAAYHRLLVSDPDTVGPGRMLVSFSREVRSFTVSGGDGTRRCRRTTPAEEEDTGARARCGFGRLAVDGAEATMRVLIRVPAELAGKQLRVAVAALPTSAHHKFRAAPRRLSIKVGQLAATFRITSVSLPSSVVSGGARGDLAVFWEGEPTFPVTLYYAPDSCPAGVGCTTPTQTFRTAANPLVFAGAVWCAGSITSSIFFDYSVYLQDAAGKRTPRKNADFTCLPGG